MAPRKRKEEAESEEIPSSESDSDFIDESEDEKPKKKAAPKKAAPPKAPAAKRVKTEEGKATPKKAPAAAKKGAKAAKEEDGEEEAEEKKPRARAAAKPKPAGPTTGPTDNGWNISGDSVIYKDYGGKPSAKIAAFDFDGTLCTVRSGAQFAMGPNDWRIYNGKVADKLKQYEADGYRIVVFSNQGGIRSKLDGKAAENARARFDGVVGALGVPATVIAATQRDQFRKPDVGMWTFFCDTLAGGVKPDISASFFVGDSIDGGDEGFAQALGLTYRTEKQEFGPADDEGAAPWAGAEAKVSVSSAVPDNAQLCSVFAQLAARLGGVGKGFEARAFKKAGEAIGAHDKPITLASLKGLKIPGVGKGSLAVIKEVLETGTTAKLTEPLPTKEAKEAKDAKPPPPGANKARDQALAFM